MSRCLCGEDWENLDVTKYFKRQDGDGILRIANHHGSANEFAKHNETTGNYGLVFLFKNTLRRFRVDSRVDYREEVYLPYDMVQEKEIQIVNGLIDWIKNGNFSCPPGTKTLTSTKKK